MSLENPLINFSNGDHDSFNHLYNLSSKKIQRLCYSYTHSAEIAEELTHDIFLKVWEKRHTIESENIEGFVFKVAKNMIYDWLRKMASDKKMKEEVAFRYRKIYLDTKQYRSDTESRIDLTFFKKTINTLPPKQRQVFELCKFDELTYAEVATKLSISRDTVKDHIMKANKTLFKMYRAVDFLYLLTVTFAVFYF